MKRDEDLISKLGDRQIERYKDPKSPYYQSQISQNVVVIFIDAISMDQLKL